jgi:hypothetical protein
MTRTSKFPSPSAHAAAPIQQRGEGFDALMAGLCLGVSLATLLALVCAGVALAQHPAHWAASYWWGLVVWAVSWFLVSGAFRLVSRHPKAIGKAMLYGVGWLLAWMFFSFISPTWGTAITAICFFLWLEGDGKFQYRPRTIKAAAHTKR